MASRKSDVVEKAMKPEPESVPTARRFVLDLGWADDERTRERLGSLTSELVTNAVLHARTPFVVKVSIRANRIRVAVTDNSKTHPAIKQHEPTSATGRGLRIVEAIADRWGVDRLKTGKTVWFELDLSKRST